MLSTSRFLSCGSSTFIVIRKSEMLNGVIKRWCWKSSGTAWQPRWRRCGQVCQYMCFYLDVYVCVAPTFAGIVFVFVLYLDEYVYCKCSIGLCRPGFGEVTALHIAVLRGHLPLVSLLTSAGGHLVLVLLLFLVLAIWPFTQSLNIRTGTKKCEDFYLVGNQAVVGNVEPNH